jgi:hypothetical protein
MPACAMAAMIASFDLDGHYNPERQQAAAAEL